MNLKDRYHHTTIVLHITSTLQSSYNCSMYNYKYYIIKICKRVSDYDDGHRDLCKLCIGYENCQHDINCMKFEFATFSGYRQTPYVSICYSQIPIFSCTLYVGYAKKTSEENFYYDAKNVRLMSLYVRNNCVYRYPHY